MNGNLHAAAGRLSTLARTISSYKLLVWPLVLAASLAVQACGGGGGGDGGSQPAPAPPPPAAPPVAAPTALSYSSPQTYTVGTAITSLTPTVTGTVTSYSVSPALPAGLALDATTGVISGTPTAPAAERAYTVTAANAGGSTTFALTMAAYLERATADRADEASGRQVHAVYVIPSDGTDQRLDTLGTIEGSVRSWNAWLTTQTGGKSARLDTYGGGKLDVSFLKLDRTDDEMNVAGGNARNKLEYHLLARGFDSPDKVYLVYYGGRGDGCGRGAWPPTLHGNVGAVYLMSAGCSNASLAGASDPPGYWDLLAVHEVLHVLGFAPACAPHHLDSGHVNDSTQDLMAPLGAQRSTLDVNHDDYFGSANAGCPDFSSSDLLEPPPAGAVAPPGWPYANLTDNGCETEATVVPGPPGADTQATFVNDYGAGATVQISELVLNTTTGLYVRSQRASIPYLEGAVVPVKENAVLVASVNNTCAAVVKAPAAISRFVVRP
jgi:hypothetical protein